MTVRFQFEESNIIIKVNCNSHWRVNLVWQCWPVSDEVTWIVCNYSSVFLVDLEFFDEKRHKRWDLTRQTNVLAMTELITNKQVQIDEICIQFVKIILCRQSVEKGERTEGDHVIPYILLVGGFWKGQLTKIWSRKYKSRRFTTVQKQPE